MPKTAVVSGGARGIGRTLARYFLEKQYHVFILDIDEQELTHTTRTHLKSYYDSKAVDSAICDLRNTDEIYEKIQQAAKFLDGHIDVVINNGAPFVVSQACIPFMKNEKDTAPVTDDSHSTAGPCIINIGSFRAKQSDPNQEGYASAKAGLLGLTHSMAVSLQPFGIRVNLVAPGRIKAGHESKEGDEKGVEWAHLNEDKDVEDHLTNRAGRPLDIAQAVEYMVNAGFVTGQDLIVDGGAVMIK
ncbi:hypothetical protein H9Q72_012374 [Fusarium xylarioides]|uniref:Short chain alcohol dehydrogenase n=1 Tax=Fusarium xylarioides TaxID=221167 RepID=A0A9P7L0K8_9HYPO|nr:hypothetical protein H9Q70_006917 [Fusarium xylarioides]KAG5759504.1 hypothetical protein H9Q72_012374 [Fusarium xylarioides]KAG5802215.1 hypothetical protein H9Q71_013204 [Fusarium xylarioides]KAG5812202.1 hypothetical protein H9Q74_013240 [Fusarium xylarioides]